MDSEEHSGGSYSCFDYVLIVLSFLLVILFMPFSLCCTLKILQEHEQVVIFRLGRQLPDGPKEPGLFFILPCTDTYQKVDLRTTSFDMPPQEQMWGRKIDEKRGVLRFAKFGGLSLYPSAMSL